MLKLNVGFNRKTGEANYGSRGASVNLELELDSTLVGDAERLKERIRHLFGLAKASVDEELAGATANGCGTNGRHAADKANGNGHVGAQAHGRRRDGTRWATASQVRALHAIAERKQLNLQALLVERFQVHDPAAITITEASSLIDELKGEAAGNGGGGRR